MQPQHAISFYDQDHHVVGMVAAFVEEGLAQGERVVLIATADHAAELQGAALTAGSPLAEAQADGRLLLLDATRTLAAFMTGGAPDRDLFEMSVGGVIAAAGADGSPVRAFGEMVALLWDQGNVTGALQLEDLWNELAQRHAFSLLCAYPATSLDVAPLLDVGRVCAAHSSVRPPSSYDATVPASAVCEEVESAVFVPVPKAVAAARRFVTLVLESWGLQDLVADAALVTSELATNAVRHAASPFRAVVDRSGPAVRISIADLELGHVASSAAAPADLHGRGVAIVEALASRWGCDPLPGGKVVWAELQA